MVVEIETKDIISILGVFIAALLGYWIAIAKEKRERKLMKVALLEELNDVRIELERHKDLISNTDFNKRTEIPLQINFVLFETAYPRVFTMFSVNQRHNIRAFMLVIQNLNRMWGHLLSQNDNKEDVYKIFESSIGYLDYALGFLVEINKQNAKKTKAKPHLSEKTISQRKDLNSRYNKYKNNKTSLSINSY